MTRTDRRTLVHKLRHEEGLSQRAIARRLSISKDTVRRDLEADPASAPDDAPPDAPDTAAAPPVSPVEAEESAPGGAPRDAPVARLPRRVADPLAGMDVSQWRALRRDFAVLAQSGMSAETLVHQAIVTLAHQYRQDLAAGRLKPGQRFLVRSMDLYLAPAEAGRTAAAAPPTEAP